MFFPFQRYTKFKISSRQREKQRSIYVKVYSPGGTQSDSEILIWSGLLQRKNVSNVMLRFSSVTINTWVWVGKRIYCTLTTRNYNYRAIVISHTGQFTTIRTESSSVVWKRLPTAVVPCLWVPELSQCLRHSKSWLTVNSLTPSYQMHCASNNLLQKSLPVISNP
jgi:hypothetical protein